MKRSTFVGITLTVLWTLAFFALLYVKRSTLPDLKVNEWGDFFAGAVAPLAFFWLVLGYAQQGEELRLNTEAHKAQHAELQRQVQETALLAAHSERQAAASEQLAVATKSEARRAELKEIADAQPLFRPSGGSGSAPNVTLNIVNSGATVYRLAIECTAVQKAQLNPTHHFESGAMGAIAFEGMPDYPFSFIITYEDRLSVQRSKVLEMIAPFQFTEARGT